MNPEQIAQYWDEYAAEYDREPDHGLLDSDTGLTAQVEASSTFAPGLFARLDDWLRARGLLA